MKPETTSSTIVKKLQAFVASDSQPDDFSAARLSKEIQKLILVDAANGYMVKGMYYCALRNHDKCVSNFRKSLALRSDSVTYQNYLISLKAFGLFRKAFNLAIEAVHTHPGDIGLSAAATQVSFNAGQLNHVLKFYKIYQKLTVNRKNKEPEELTASVKAASQLLENGIDTREFSTVIQLSESVLQDNNVKAADSTYFTHDDEFSYFTRINAGPEVTASLNDQLCRRLAALEDLVVYNFTLVFMPTTD